MAAAASTTTRPVRRWLRRAGLLLVGAASALAGGLGVLQPALDDAEDLERRVEAMTARLVRMHAQAASLGSVRDQLEAALERLRALDSAPPLDRDADVRAALAASLAGLVQLDADGVSLVDGSAEHDFYRARQARIALRLTGLDLPELVDAMATSPLLLLPEGLVIERLAGVDPGVALRGELVVQVLRVPGSGEWGRR